MTGPEALAAFNRAPRLLDFVAEEPGLVIVAALLIAFIVDRLT